MGRAYWMCWRGLLREGRREVRSPCLSQEPVCLLRAHGALAAEPGGFALQFAAES